MRRSISYAMIAATMALTFAVTAIPSMGQTTRPRLTGQTNGEGAENKSAAAGDTHIWRDPGAVEQLDFAAGPGGVDGAPKPPFKFLKEDMDGSNPKINIEDANGVKWGAKWGTEVNSEVFATRIAWAAGYYVEPTYFVKSGTIVGATGLKRAKKFVGSDGSFTDARFERKDKRITKLKDDQGWAWHNNPFAGTKELNGLKIVMMLVSNWDSKDVRDVSRGSNTAIFQVPVSGGTENWYVVTDWGGSLGKWGGVFSREKWDCKGFAGQNSRFTNGARGTNVEFGYSGQRTSDITEGIRVRDVQWIMQYLGRITDDQLRAGLEASGATPDEVECFTQALRDRLNQLKAIS
jgi:hypothetical protein